MERLASYIAGSWQQGRGDGRYIRHALTGEVLYQVSSQGLPLAQALTWGREKGGTVLQQMTFHQRANMLKELAKHLLMVKERFYQLSYQTGATRQDSWVDIEGGIGTLFSYASLALRELPDDVIWPEDPLIPLARDGQFVARHFLTSKAGIALHINAYNFPCWGMLEKLAPTWLAGMPALIKPATATAQVTQAMVDEILLSGLVPEGALQLVCGELGDIMEHLTQQDIVTFTGSARTGQLLQQHPTIIAHSVPFTMESDSLNCAILAEDVTEEMAEFSLFIEEVYREMTVKAGQKCTAIRRVIVPASKLKAVSDALVERLQQVVMGDPALDGVTMGALVSAVQRQDVADNVALLLQGGCQLVYGGESVTMSLVGERLEPQAFYPPTLLYCADPLHSPQVHAIEAFGPVCTLLPYEGEEQAVEIACAGGGSLVGTLVTADQQRARRMLLAVARAHGRFLVLDATAAPGSTGHGSPLPQLIHGGPGRAGGGEEMGGVRGIKHFMQRTAIQGSPSMLATIGGEWVKGAAVTEDCVHPFRKYFDELVVGESLLTARRTVTEADVVNFAALSGDRFYLHVDEIAAEQSMFGARVAHGYFILAASAGLFVDPAEGPVLANYGLENLRFIEPVKFGDTIQVRLTCKKKIKKQQKKVEDRLQGVVQWDVEVTNQRQELVAFYTILTLVAAKELAG